MAANNRQSEQEKTDNAIRSAAEDKVEDADNTGGDALGDTQDPSPALQTSAVTSAAADVTTDPETVADVETSKAFIQSKNGTITFVPSKAS